MKLRKGITILCAFWCVGMSCTGDLPPKPEDENTETLPTTKPEIYAHLPHSHRLWVGIFSGTANVETFNPPGENGVSHPTRPATLTVDVADNYSGDPSTFHSLAPMMETNWWGLPSTP